MPDTHAIDRLPRAWCLTPAPAWLRRLKPMRQGQELLYYDGPWIQTQWSVDDEESLWIKQAEGSDRTRWWVTPLHTAALERIAQQGHYRAAFEHEAELLLVDQIYPPVIRGRIDMFDRYTVHSVSGAPLDVAIGPASYARDVAEWAGAMLDLRAEQALRDGPLA